MEIQKRQPVISVTEPSTDEKNHSVEEGKESSEKSKKNLGVKDV